MEKKDIRQYLHYYLNCEVQVSEDLRIGKLLGIVEGQYAIGFGYNHKLVKIFSVGDFKPILRRLEDLTQDERKELWLLVFGREFHKNGSTVFIKESSLTSDPRWVLSSGVERLGIELNGTVWADSDLHIWKHNQHEVTHYLLSKGYDLFNLIPEGLAIDKETLNPCQ